MLQQILKDLFVDPEILAELDEEQKQILFVKMREEQVRRWKENEDKFEQETNNKPKPGKPNAKKVGFLMGADGCEWVWVMGEHRTDLTIEEILEQEAQQKAQVQAEKEAALQREREEQELKKKLEEEKRRVHQETERLEKELKQKKSQATVDDKARQEVAKIAQLKQQYEEAEQKRLQELSDEQRRLRRRSAEVLESVKKHRSSEIYQQWKAQREQLDKQAQEGSKIVEATFKQQEEKSKEADKEMREIARRARLEYKESLRRTNTMIQATAAFSSGKEASPNNKPPIPPKKHLLNRPPTIQTGDKMPKPRPLRPRNRNMVIDWFLKEEKEKGAGLELDSRDIAPWFHGIISRLEAEHLLSDKGTGSFLVRVSERVWGYTVSYQEKGRCKHFLIDTTDRGYQFFGANQVTHKSLAELVAFHKDTPITISGQEKLLEPIGQVSDPPDYCELFQGRQSVSTSL